MTAFPARAVASVGASALALAALAPIVWGAQAAGAPSVREGEHEGASYVISVPAKWNGGRAQAAGAGHLLVQRAVRWPGHCSFDGAVREQAFDDLVAWMERGVVPAGDDVVGDVTKLGLRWTPARKP